MAYISDCLTHFVGRTQPDDDARCDLLIKILRARTLEQWNRQGQVRISPGSIRISVDGSLCKDEFIRFSPVCFCDIPEESLGRHTRFYGQFGLAFKKEFLVTKGANPVFYIAKGSLARHERSWVPPLTENDLKANPKEVIKFFESLTAEGMPVQRCEFYDRLIKDLIKVLPPPVPADTPAPWREVQIQVLFDLLEHVFAFMKFFDESLSEDKYENFYMEREWRVADFVKFELCNIKKVYVAKGFRDRILHEIPGLDIKELDQHAS